jgi:hypothetical protein
MPLPQPISTTDDGQAEAISATVSLTHSRIVSRSCIFPVNESVYAWRSGRGSWWRRRDSERGRERGRVRAGAVAAARRTAQSIVGSCSPSSTWKWSAKYSSS